MHIRSRPAAECTLTASASKKIRHFEKEQKPVLSTVWYTGRLASENGGHLQQSKTDSDADRF